MKTSFAKIIILLTIGFAIAIFSSCGNNTEDPTPVAAAPVCKFKTEATTSTTQPQAGAGGGALGSTGTANVAHDYDAQGRIIKTVTSNTSQSINGANPYSYTVTSNFTYNANGFVIGRTDEKVSISSNVTTPTTTTTTYQYTADRITSTVAQTTGTTPSASNTRTTTYEYDAAGNLTKITDEILPSGYKTVATYANGILTNYAYKASSTAAEINPFTLSNGLVTRAAYFASSYTNYTYDASERQIKIETFSNNAINSYYTYEYEDTMKPSFTATPTFKGFPTVKSHNGTQGVSKKYEYYGVVPNVTTPLLMNRTTAVNQANAKGMVISTVETNNQYAAMNAAAILTHVITSNKAYTYIDCP